MHPFHQEFYCINKAMLFIWDLFQLLPIKTFLSHQGKGSIIIIFVNENSKGHCKDNETEVRC